jgi:hypothetical protein
LQRAGKLGASKLGESQSCHPVEFVFRGKVFVVGIRFATRFGGGDINDNGMSHLSALKHLENFQLTFAYGCTDKGLEYLKDLKNMKVLNLGSHTFGEGVIHLGGMTKLEQLTLHKVRADDESLKFMRNLKQLKILSMTLNPVATDKGMEHLAELRELESLYLTCSNLTDNCLEIFAPMKKLKTLTISSPQITKKGLRELCKPLPLLETVDRQPVEKFLTED